MKAQNYDNIFSLINANCLIRTLEVEMDFAWYLKAEIQIVYLVVPLCCPTMLQTIKLKRQICKKSQTRWIDKAMTPMWMSCSSTPIITFK